jgi:hypothetical protein
MCHVCSDELSLQYVVPAERVLRNPFITWYAMRGCSALPSRGTRYAGALRNPFITWYAMLGCSALPSRGTRCAGAPQSLHNVVRDARVLRIAESWYPLCGCSAIPS